MEKAKVIPQELARKLCNQQRSGTYKPPFKGRKRGERSAKGLVPPFHEKGTNHTKYKS